MKKQTVRDIDLKGKRVLVRVDYNVPMERGEVADTFRIEASLPTLKYLLDQGCSLVLLSHLGEPAGAPDLRYSLKPVATKAAELLGRPIAFYDDCAGADFQSAAAALRPGEVIMGENVRFHQPELDNDPAFAKQLAGLGEVYVNDAFAVDHREQASVSGVAKYLPAVAGLLVEQEVNHLSGAIDNPNRPLVAVIGGAKVSTKIDILKNLIAKVDSLLLTGPIANTYALAKGRKIGRSVAERHELETIKQLMELARTENTELLLPREVIVSKSLEHGDDMRTVTWDGIQSDDYVVDAAPSYAQTLKDTIFDFLDFDGKCTIIWNGPLGLAEIDEFAAGSRAMAQAIIDTKGTSVVGGGDTVAFVHAEHLADKFTWVSTGGGASLELLAGKPMPGIDSLLDK
ncbi:MAG TPA: phosphoglycerate kinase [Candidatus Saccharimonas sp.]|nr:phosphoglycerate kinase [Candidatus Saccharimonas sp.]